MAKYHRLTLISLLLFNSSAFAANSTDLGYMMSRSTSSSAAEREALEMLIVNPRENPTPILEVDGYKPRSRWDELAKAKVDTFGQCGKFDPNLSVLNSFNDGNLNVLFNNVITSAVTSVQGFAGQLMKEMNPGFYEFLENGIDLGYNDYLSSLQSCEEMQKFIKNAPENIMKFTSQQEEMAKYSEQGNVDIIDLTRSGSRLNGDAGVTGVTGNKFGGAGQRPLKVVAQTSLAGYCGLTETTSGDCSDVVGTNVTGSGGTSSTAIKKIFATNQEAEDFAVELLGETNYRTCSGCETIRTTPPQSIAQLVEKESTELVQKLTELTQDRNITQEKLDDVSAPNYQITEATITALRAEQTDSRQVFIERLAFDVASSKTIDKIIATRQILLTGRSNANITGNEAMMMEVNSKLNALTEQINNFQQEIALRDSINSNTRIILNERRFHSRGTKNENALSIK
ncbi:hypothetical protein [Vibrio gangliei]|uniref:hypothetical protein n=1 Tax=Vibrio gangliei TaxID=2077090 RepID=UPI000D01F0C0|nr:hypothetical protein [Vibrio gangliei]